MAEQEPYEPPIGMNRPKAKTMNNQKRPIINKEKEESKKENSSNAFSSMSSVLPPAAHMTAMEALYMGSN